MPIYKCLVNTDWETSGMANVIVLRQHVNGNVSGAVYLVDLFCLGVKDTMWFFNEDETGVMEKFNKDDAPELKTIDYQLAHNIVYAGHDFAMDYDIRPHPGFKTSKFVLEEDDDSIPLVDIKTGFGGDGIPHLMVHQPGQYADALAKLKKNAGEGNYHYTIAIGETTTMDDEGEDDRFFDDEGIRPLSDFADGELTLQNVQDVFVEDLGNEAMVSARSPMDRMICLTEMMLRILPADFYENEQGWADAEWDELQDMHRLPYGITEADFEEWEKAFGAYKAADETKTKDPAASALLLEDMVLQYGHNPLAATILIADAIVDGTVKAKEWLEKWQPQHGEIPVFKLLGAFYEVLENERSGMYTHIIDSKHISDAFPTQAGFNVLEFALFHALQCFKNCRAKNLTTAVEHYYLAAGTDIVHIMFVPMLGELQPLLRVYIEERLEKDGNPRF